MNPIPERVQSLAADIARQLLAELSLPINRRSVRQVAKSILDIHLGGRPLDELTRHVKAEAVREVCSRGTLLHARAAAVATCNDRAYAIAQAALNGDAKCIHAVFEAACEARGGLL